MLVQRPAGFGLKIGVPKIRFSRKLIFITLGISVLLGGSGGAALYIGGAELLGKPRHNAAGGICTDVQTMVLKTPSNHLWLRKYIRMENADGPERVRTALRIAGLLAKKNTVDLIHVSVLDVHGPEKRAGMRGRAIGAEVLVALKPENLPEMKSPAMASYYEGPVSDQGRFYGDKVAIDIEEIGQMMTAMRSVEDKADCEKPESAEDPTGKKNGQGAKDEKKPANDLGSQTKSEGHAEDPAKDGEKAEAHEPAKEQSFLDSVLSMVGLGGSEEKPAAEGEYEAVADEPVESVSVEHGVKPETAEVQIPPAETDAEATEHAPAKSDADEEHQSSGEHTKPATSEAAAH